MLHHISPTHVRPDPHRRPHHPRLFPTKHLTHRVVQIPLHAQSILHNHVHRLRVQPELFPPLRVAVREEGREDGWGLGELGDEFRGYEYVGVGD